jgi:uncharacterized protein YpiB (UPF0302 family)
MILTKQILKRKKTMRILNLMMIKMERLRSINCKKQQMMTLSAGMTCSTSKYQTPPK